MEHTQCSCGRGNGCGGGRGGGFDGFNVFRLRVLWWGLDYVVHGYWSLQPLRAPFFVGPCPLRSGGISDVVRTPCEHLAE